MLVFLSSDTPKNIISALEGNGARVIPLPPFSALQKPVASHADMLLLACGKTLFVHKDYPLPREPLFCTFDKVVSVNEPISSKYPNDILLNIAIVGDNVFANTQFASKTALDFLAGQGKKICHVKQGYTHCSTCIVGDNAIITSDIGISNAAKSAGVDTLLISSGHISLPGYDYGFIGGASGSDRNNIYFCGSLSYHPDGISIQSFCQKHGKTVVELSNSPLVDIGGILLVE